MSTCVQCALNIFQSIDYTRSRSLTIYDASSTNDMASLLLLFVSKRHPYSFIHKNVMKTRVVLSSFFFACHFGRPFGTSYSPVDFWVIAFSSFSRLQFVCNFAIIQHHLCVIVIFYVIDKPIKTTFPLWKVVNNLTGRTSRKFTATWMKCTYHGLARNAALEKCTIWNVSANRKLILSVHYGISGYYYVVSLPVESRVDFVQRAPY